MVSIKALPRLFPVIEGPSVLDSEVDERGKNDSREMKTAVRSVALAFRRDGLDLLFFFFKSLNLLPFVLLLLFRKILAFCITPR